MPNKFGEFLKNLPAETKDFEIVRIKIEIINILKNRTSSKICLKIF